MNITRYVSIKPQALAELIGPIEKTLLAQLKDAELSYSAISITTRDGKYDGECKEILALQYQKLAPMVEIVGNFKFQQNGQSTTELYVHSHDNRTIITCTNQDAGLIERTLDGLAIKVFKKSYIKYSPMSDTLQHQKQIVDKSINILRLPDQLQLRKDHEINNEKQFQHFLYPILRSHFDDLIDENFLPTYGASAYKPDFGIPSGKVLIEAKYMRAAGDMKKIQREVHDDSIGYFGSNKDYKTMIVVIFDSTNSGIDAQILRDLKKNGRISDIVVWQNVRPVEQV